MKVKPWWQWLLDHAKQLITPVTVTAAAMTALVVWAYLPILQADAAEVRAAIVKPNTESMPNLQALAALAHQLFFVEAIVICEILLIGTFFILLIRFAFYIVRLIVHEYRRTRRELRGRSRPRTRVKEKQPDAAPSVDGQVAAQEQQRIQPPAERKMYLIPGPTQVPDPRKRPEVKDGSSKDGQAK